jgi:predicted DNA-binding protein YlxM (UPF0122 family)
MRELAGELKVVFIDMTAITIKLYNSKEYSVKEIEEMTNVSRATLYRKLKTNKNEKDGNKI